jgi:hypothetical protein
MAKSRKVNKSRKHTRRAGAKAVAAKFASVADACRKILRARSKNAEKLHAEASALFAGMNEEQQTALDTCLAATVTPELKEDAEALIESIEDMPNPSPAPSAAPSRSTTPSTVTASEGEDLMEIERDVVEPQFPIINAEEVPMELDGGRKRRKSRRGGRKHKKSTRRH